MRSHHGIHLKVKLLVEAADIWYFQKTDWKLVDIEIVCDAANRPLVNFSAADVKFVFKVTSLCGIIK